MTDEDLIHAPAEPDLSQSGQQSSVPTKTMGRIEWEARIGFYKAEGWHPDFHTAWEDLAPDQHAAMEAGADAVIEECAKIADERSKTLQSEYDRIWDGYPSEREVERATRLASSAGEMHRFAQTLRNRMCRAAGHASDCALHNEPAFPASPCDCGLVTSPQRSGDRPADPPEQRSREPNISLKSNPKGEDHDAG